MNKVAIIGAGITGLSCAQMLKEHYQPVIFERGSAAGGLIKCSRVQDCLFHRVGGHVFNSRRPETLDWFWGFFDREREFLLAKRNAKIWLQGKVIGYPIENYLWQLPSDTVELILQELLAIHAHAAVTPPAQHANFESFLKSTFGSTLYRLYFEPYNTKVWNTPLSQVPLGWLEGKLPMPDLKQILMSNIMKREEQEMVHSTFYYAREGGSQFIVDRLAHGLDVRLSTNVTSLKRKKDGWEVNGESFAAVVFTGDVRGLPSLLKDADAEVADAVTAASAFKSNGTSNLFCETDSTDISWMYLPDHEIAAHRIIYTGTFADSNNRGSDRMTCVVEFSGRHDLQDMIAQLAQLPGNLAYLDHNYEPNSYVVQDGNTRPAIQRLKKALQHQRFFLAGRFAEWEYHNMDKAIEAAMAVTRSILMV